MLLQTPLSALRIELGQRGVLGHFIKLKGLENSKDGIMGWARR